MVWNIGDLYKGKRLTFDHKEKISKTKRSQYKAGRLKLPDNTGKIPWNRGKKWPLEVRRKMSTSRKGSIPWNVGIAHSVKTKHKISASRKGKPAWNKGQTISATHKKAISKAMRIKWQTRREGVPS